MAKWRRGGGGRRGGRWTIEYVPKPKPITPKVNEPSDPFTFDTPEAILAALWRFEQRKLLTAADD